MLKVIKVLSIIIVNYKSSDDISRCLSSIVKYETKFIDYEFIIVDNNSNDHKLKELNEKFPFIKIIYAPQNGGFAYGNNVGIRHSSGEFVFLLNPDTYIEDNSIETLLDRIASDASIDIIGPKLLNTDKTNQSFFAPKSYLTLWKLFCQQLYLHKLFKRSKIFNSYYRTYMNYNEETLVEQVSGAALMFRRSVLNMTGLLDENYFMYFEESDFCLQAIKKGKKLLYYPKSIIIHIHADGIQSEGSINYFVNSFKHHFKKNFKTAYYPALFIYSIGSVIRLVKSLIVGDNKFVLYLYNLKYLFKQ